MPAPTIGSAVASRVWGANCGGGRPARLRAYRKGRSHRCWHHNWALRIQSANCGVPSVRAGRPHPQWEVAFPHRLNIASGAGSDTDGTLGAGLLDASAFRRRCPASPDQRGHDRKRRRSNHAARTSGGLLTGFSDVPGMRSPWVARHRSCAERVSGRKAGGKHSSVPGTPRRTPMCAVSFPDAGQLSSPDPGGGPTSPKYSR